MKMDITAIIAGVTATFGTIGTIFGLVQKARADKRATDLNEFKEINSSYKELYTTVKSEVEEMRKEVDALKAQVDRYKAEIMSLQVTEHSCQGELDRLRAENERILKHLNID